MRGWPALLTGGSELLPRPGTTVIVGVCCALCGVCTGGFWAPHLLRLASNFLAIRIDRYVQLFVTRIGELLFISS